MWRMPQARLSFMITTTYDTLPSPQNLHLWYGTEETFHLCSSSNSNPQHILEACRLEANNTSLLTSHHLMIKFNEKLIHLIQKPFKGKCVMSPSICVWFTNYSILFYSILFYSILKLILMLIKFHTDIHE